MEKEKNKNEKIKINRKILSEHYYKEFKKCYENKIYFSAMIILEAAREALLIDVISSCSDNNKKESVIENLFKKKLIRNKKLQDL